VQKSTIPFYSENVKGNTQARDNRELKQTMAATTKRTPPNKRFGE